MVINIVLLSLMIDQDITMEKIYIKKKKKV